MGHTVRNRPREPRGIAETHAALRGHPNFSFPELPTSRSPEALVDFILEAVARFVSPPKLDDEHEQFVCEDIADAIRTKLKPELLERLADA